MTLLSKQGSFPTTPNITLDGIHRLLRADLIELPRSILRDTALSARARIVLLLLIDYAQSREGVLAHQDDLASDAGIKKTQLRETLRALEDAGYLRRVRGTNRAPTDYSVSLTKSFR